VKGAGKAFCAGHDLREMQDARHSPDQGRAAFTTLFSDCAAMIQALSALPQPTIAQVQGVATAAGCQLVASCDLAVATTTARFGVNGINIGLFCTTPMVALTRKVAPAVAFEMLSTGAFIDAARAREVGLINRIAAPEDIEAATENLAQTLAAKQPEALQMGKAAFAVQSGLSLHDAYARAGATMVENILLDATNQGIAAFLDKRR
jgi:enoyl-CoA hydratase/carnithine racemase